MAKRRPPSAFPYAVPPLDAAIPSLDVMELASSEWPSMCTSANPDVMFCATWATQRTPRTQLNLSTEAPSSARDVGWLWRSAAKAHETWVEADARAFSTRCQGLAVPLLVVGGVIMIAMGHGDAGSVFGGAATGGGGVLGLCGLSRRRRGGDRLEKNTDADK
jgi:hypothetical protein